MHEPALTIRGDVGPVTGDVEHRGDILITGSVMSGRQVRAGGRLVVRGNVRSSSLTAGCDLVVEGYVSGAGTLLDAVEDVRVRHVSDARIIAGRDIHVGRVSERSSLLAGRRVTLKGHPALLRGGKVWATEGLEAHRIESAGGEAPEVRLGEMPFEETADELRERIAAAKNRSDSALARTEASVAEYQRHCAAATIYRTLSETLSRRLRQVETAAAVEGEPWLCVRGAGPILARVTLGPVDDALPGLDSPAGAGFVATISDGEVLIAPLMDEEACGDS